MSFNLEGNNYRKEEDIYIPAGIRSDFAYSDGEQVERLLLEGVQRSKDISVGSEELQKQIVDWPTLYHLSPKRANILRPFADQLRNKNVLEIGSGCGAVTRFLGELGCRVLSLEGSLQRAKITRERCRDLENVTVVNDNFKNFTCDEKFDFVILVGVLEYANLFMEGSDDKPLAMLTNVKNNLTADGNVIIAIENKVGLKYWAGAPEDHNGKVYYGTQNLYTHKDVTTFGHHEISSLLKDTGFSISAFQYPFPDYKLPDIIVTDEGFNKAGFAVPEMLLEKFEYFQNTGYASQFSSTLSSYALSNNKLLTHFANSFLILATVSQTPAPKKEQQVLANVYTVTRKKKYCKLATFSSSQNSQQISVIKQLLYEIHAEDAPYVRHELQREEYINGQILFGTLLPIVSKNGWTTTDIINWVRIYYDFLISKSIQNSNQTWISGSYIDLTPFNIILFEKNQQVFDQEWVASEDLPVYYVFFRGLIHSLGKILFVNNPGPDTTLNVTKLASEVTRHYFPFDDNELLDCKRREIKYFSPVIVNENPEPFPAHNLNVRNGDYYRFLETKSKQESLVQDLQQRLHQTEEDAVRLRQSYSISENALAEKNIIVSNQSQTIAFLKDRIEETSQTLQLLTSNVKDSELIIQKQKEKEQNLNLQLETVNSRLNEIYGSDGWRLLKKYYNIKGRVLREDSKRYKFLKKALNTIRGKKEIGQYGSNTANTSQRSTPTEIINYEVINFDKYDNPAVSIIVPVFNGWDVTYRCLRSIHLNTIATSFEIIVADDGATDETSNIDQYIKNIRVIRNEKNLGFLHNCNNAAKQARGKYILFLNNDTEVRAGWLSALTDLMDKDASIGMSGSKLIYPDGKLQEAGGIIWKDASAWNFGHKQDPAAPQFNYLKEADYISGAAIIIRSALWNEIGGFDTRYAPAYCEDSDLAFEVRKRGFKVVYQPLSEVVHYEGYSHGVEGQQGSIKEYQKINNLKLKEKWNDVLQKEHFPNGENVFWARDRSRYKKTILVVDHYVPQYDKDAGSKTVFQYLGLFVSMGLNVKFIGDNFYRHEPYTTTLQQMGIEVLYGQWCAENWKHWIKDNHDKLDYILLNRPHITIKYIDFLKENTKAKILYYGHDLHFVREMKQYEIEKNPLLLKSAEKWKETEMNIFQKSDIVLTPSIEEAEQIKSLGIARVVPIKAYIFTREPVPFDDFSNKRDILFIGGFSHLPNVDAVLWFAKEIWPIVRQANPEMQFLIAGSNPPEIIKNLADNNTKVVGYVSDEKLNNLYNSVRAVIIPLRFGAGVKGKTVEAMYKGTPIITTSFGIEGLPGVSSFIHPKDNAADFAKEVIKIYNSTNEKLAEISSNETDYISSNFMLENVKKELVHIFEKLETKNHQDIYQ